ncbi:hypothetical protein PISMIDRAFT_140092 [Pisolithus microcarpus 441]|uniref:Uncharacterized protein n=1 Tax=Pisolithus microcarpus 441 TaxID=765257 RepID=A0A0D0AGU1_9AGAM|nr:hypothetical protein PISMIDRAFT_140092 [Pisolithus microcarpus 441]
MEVCLYPYCVNQGFLLSASDEVVVLSPPKKNPKKILVAARFELARTFAHWDSNFLNPTP